MLIKKTQALEEFHDTTDGGSGEMVFYHHNKNFAEKDFRNLCVDPPEKNRCLCKQCYRITIYPSDGIYGKMKEYYFGAVQ